MTATLPPAVHALMLADLGQKVINAITATQVLGHTRLIHTFSYNHTDDPSVTLVQAVIAGDTAGAVEQLDRWRLDAEAKALADISARAAS